MNGIKIKFDEFPSAVIISYYADFVYEDHRHICVFYVFFLCTVHSSLRELAGIWNYMKKKTVIKYDIYLIAYHHQIMRD